MYMLKVANPRKSSELGKEKFDDDGVNNALDSLISPLLSGLNREQEMSAMVSALAHVVAGDVVEGGAAAVSGGACKRGREEQPSESAVTRFCRGFSDFSVGTTASNSGHYLHL